MDIIYCGNCATFAMEQTIIATSVGNAR